MKFTTTFIPLLAAVATALPTADILDERKSAPKYATYCTAPEICAPIQMINKCQVLDTGATSVTFPANTKHCSVYAVGEGASVCGGDAINGLGTGNFTIEDPRAIKKGVPLIGAFWCD
jgi:hypothetical protein